MKFTLFYNGQEIAHGSREQVQHAGRQLISEKSKLRGILMFRLLDDCEKHESASASNWYGVEQHQLKVVAHPEQPDTFFKKLRRVISGRETTPNSPLA